MKRFRIYACLFLLAGFFSCNSLKSLKGGLTEQEAIDAIRETLSIGSKYGGTLLGNNGAFTKESLLSAIFPPELQKVAAMLQTLGLSKEVDRFTTTLATAAEQTAAKSVPVFLDGIKKMKIKDALKIITNGGNSATDFLRITIGDTLRKSITPVMNNSLDEYKLSSEWNKLIKPAQLFVGEKINLDLGNLMAGLVANAMFAKIEEKEREIRARAEARSSSLLQKVFGNDWSNYMNKWKQR